MTVAYDPARTAFVLVDPYNDFFADDAMIYPRLREVAEAVGLRRAHPGAAKELTTAVPA